MKSQSLILAVSIGLLSFYGCGSESSDGDAPSNTGEITLSTCSESFGSDVPSFFSKYFACVDVTTASGGTTISTDGLPPHKSPYYPSDNPNFVAFDDRGGTHRQNPGEIGETNYSVTIPENPVAKGITIDSSMVDNQVNTSNEEYSLGSVGVSLNGVVIFAAMAGPGDNLADEQYTFDLYEGHPAGTRYHYHFETKGPLEVLVDRGLSDNAEPGSGSIELYGAMCDGTLVLGCTELDGTNPSDSDFDAQNGHVHDITDGTTSHFSNRYHTHVCPGSWPSYIFFPEIAYYEDTNCR